MNTRIKTIRQDAGMTQKVFAESLGISRSALASYESLHSIPTNSFIKLICLEYRVNEEWLRTGQGEIYAESAHDLIRRVAVQYGIGFYAVKFLEWYTTLDDKRKEDFNYLINSFSQAVGKTNSLDEMRLVAAVDNVMKEFDAKARR